MLVEFITSKQLLFQTGANHLPPLSAVCWLFLYFSTLTRHVCERKSVYVLVRVCMCTSACLHVHVGRRYVFVLFPYMRVCVCVCERWIWIWTTNQLMEWWLSLWPFRKAPVGSIKASWLSAEQGSRSSVQADACDKIMIRLLSGFHIDKLTTTYHRHHLACVPCGRWSDADDRTAIRSIRAMRPVDKVSGGQRELRI